jgi:peptidoglycan/LPS O-acetylase OafA/YrhL
MVAAGAAVGGLVCWIGMRVRPRLSLRAQVALGLVGGIGAVMSIVHPPPFKHASAAPIVATVLLLAGATAALIRARQASDLHR